ncbi:hypothetical protein [Paraliobacillus ryukyuensis]|uniref:hypothetical protein n=1 Tax=Paraliobacillus ryukyuensis TaxID=200904 RepID=UPI0015C44B0F|nr:hypothetical protein [Paraliobacillus ryukyuensis]
MNSLQFTFIIPLLDKEEIHTGRWDYDKSCYVIDSDDILTYTKEKVESAIKEGNWVLV